MKQHRLCFSLGDSLKIVITRLDELLNNCYHVASFMLAISLFHPLAHVYPKRNDTGVKGPGATSVFGEQIRDVGRDLRKLCSRRPFASHKQKLTYCKDVLRCVKESQKALLQGHQVAIEGFLPNHHLNPVDFLPSSIIRYSHATNKPIRMTLTHYDGQGTSAHQVAYFPDYSAFDTEELFPPGIYYVTMGGHRNLSKHYGPIMQLSAPFSLEINGSTLSELREKQKTI